MKKVLVYATGRQGAQEGSALEMALENINLGNEVFYLTCGQCMGGCNDNSWFNPTICRYCKHVTLKRAKKYLGKDCKIGSIDDYWKDIAQSVPSFHFELNKVSELKSLTYKGVQIGYGALSTYISLTRNMEPDFRKVEIQNYFQDLLNQQVRLIEIFERVLSDYQPELFCFHNGRFAQYKPCLGIAQKCKIDFICTETMLKSTGEAMKNNFYNDIPHSIKANQQHYVDFWNSTTDNEEKIKVAESFFINRRYGKYAGDKIYIKNQIRGKLPADWDAGKENIVIFNSSEDEFCAIDDMVDKASLYRNQLEGIKDIMNHFGEETGKHFYLRIHPNLTGVPYSYHQDLYKLSYKNLTIIPATSDISSYALMDAASKVIVFGSTMGVESAYWKKPVICIGYALYTLLDVVYLPKTTSELYKLIDTKDLPTKYSDEVLKYGFYYMSDKHEHFKYVENGIKKMKILGKLLFWPMCNTILHSHLIDLLVVLFVQRFALKIIKNSQYARIPV